MVVRRAARRRDVANAQLRLRRAGTRHDVQPRGRRSRAHRRRRAELAAACPPVEGIRRHAANLLVIAGADGNQRRPRRRNRVGVERANVADAHSCERRLAADRRMTVRMLAVEKTDERAVGHGPGHVAQLDEPVQPQLPDPGEIVLGERGTNGHVGQSREPALEKPVKNGDRDGRSIRTEVGVELLRNYVGGQNWNTEEPLSEIYLVLLRGRFFELGVPAPHVLVAEAGVAHDLSPLLFGDHWNPPEFSGLE